MKIAFISSMNLKLYHQYGKRFLEEFARHSSSDLVLFIAFEGEYPEEILSIGKNIIIMPFSCPSHTNFLKKFGHLQEAHGLRIKTIEEDGQKKIKLSSDYRWNAIRFSFKPYSIFHILDYIPKDLDYLIWTDSDLRCKKEFSSSDLIEFMPGSDEIMSYLGRKNSYSECGFLGFNIKNNTTIEYIKRMIDVYSTGEIFALEQWHDSFIWDWVRKEFETNNNSKFKNISGDGYDKEHVFMNTKLSIFFDHLKGPQRKISGESTKEDISRGIGGKIVN